MKKYNKKENYSLSFEIEFFEKLLKDNPDFIDALIPLAEAYTKAGEYEKGLDIDKRLAKVLPDDPVVRYNLACSYSLVGRIDDAFEALHAAVQMGYNDFRHMDADPDLSGVRNDQRYQKMVSDFAEKKRSKKWNG